MYTQCPECEGAFRVSPKVLQKASGRVRCGSCGHAFNANEYLTAKRPEHYSTGPEQSPDPGGDNAKVDAQNKALLETLDELSGPDNVRIEDTGVEWQVLDNEEAGADTADMVAYDLSRPQENLQFNDTVNVASSERRYDDNTPLADDFDDLVEPPHTPAAEKPDRCASDIAQQDPGAAKELQIKTTLSDPKEWTDILDEVGVTGASQFDQDDEAPDAQLLAEPGSGEREIPFEVEEELAAIHSDLAASSEVPKSAVNDRPDQTGRTAAEEDNEASVELSLDSIDELAGDGDAERILEETTGAFEKHLVFAQKATDRDEVEESSAEDQLRLHDGDRVDLDELAIFDYEPDEPPATTIEEQPIVATSDDDHVVPPQTDQEASIDKEIDQELMLVSTSDNLMAQSTAAKDLDIFSENSPDVETIVMEGDFVVNALATDHRNALKKLQDPAKLADTYMLNKGMIRGGRRTGDPPGHAVYAGIILLLIALAAQIIHASRDSIATLGVFNQTIGPVYRALGRPVTPAWNIKGWQFEATNGSTDEQGEVLTILSRLVNQSAQPLPYPLVHVSLTDRYEETIGSRVLEPNEYLAVKLDPSKPVVPGENFTAIITIDSPSEDATGFKLNVCYRVAPGRVRCAIQDFKN